MRKIFNFILNIFKWLLKHLTRIIKYLFNLLVNNISLIPDILFCCGICLLLLCKSDNLLLKNIIIIITTLYVYLRNFFKNSAKSIRINKNSISYNNRSFIYSIINSISLILIIIYNYINFKTDYYYLYLIFTTTGIISIVLNVENFKYISNGIKSKLKNSINLKSLSPITNYNYYSLYVDTISKSCQELSNNNIAIDGKYGSGKSSVINTFIEKNNKKFVFLNVSFAKFSNSDIDENKIMDQIYQEILIHDVKKPNYFFGILISGLLFSIFILLNTIKSIIVFDNFIHLLCSIIFASFFFIITLLIYNMKKGKLGIGDSSLELEKNDNEIDTNKLKLLKLLNKFNKPIIILIEDLDRFDDVTIFQNFRELNFLLNNKLSNRTIFIYALDTSIFDNCEERTKFFDIIIPIIPIGIKENAFEYFNKDTIEEIEPKLLSICSNFSNNLRIINNIQNEYTLIKKRFLDFNNEYYSSEKNKIFTLVMFKNLYPKQYVELYEYNNFLDEIFKSLSDKKYRNNTKSTTSFSENIKMYLPTNSPLIHTSLNDGLLSYADFESSINEFIFYDENKITKDLQYKYKFTKVRDADEKRKLKDLLFELVTIGTLDFDYFEYITPITFNNKQYSADEKTYKIDCQERKYIISNNDDVDLNHTFFKPYDIIRSLPEICFTYNSIHNYSIIHTLFDNPIFGNKKNYYAEMFLRTINENNEKLKDLLFKVIDAYLNDRNATDLNILKTCKISENIFKLFTKENDDIIYLSKFLFIMLQNDNNTELLNICKDIITKNPTIKSKINSNYEYFYQYLKFNDKHFFITQINTTLSFSEKNNELNRVLVKSNLFSNTLDSCLKLCSNLGCAFSKIENTIDFIENNKDISKNYNSNISLILNNFANGKTNFNEKQSIFNKLDKYFSFSEQSINKLIKEIIMFDVLNDTTISKKYIYTLIDVLKLPYSKEWLDYIKKDTNFDKLELYKYICTYIDRIFVDGIYLDYISNENMNKYIQENLLDEFKLNIAFKKYKIDFQNNSQHLKTNSLKYALKKDKAFKVVPITFLFTCQEVKLLNEFKKYKNRDYYFEEFKKANGNLTRLNNLSYKQFVQIVLYDKISLDSNNYIRVL